MLGGRKCTWTSKSPGSPSDSQNFRTGATSGSSVTHALQVPAEGLLLLPVGLPLGERGALVPGLLALRERDLDLRPAVLEVERQRDDGEALLADPALDLVDLDPVEEQLALAAGGVVGPGALGVLRDVYAVQPGLVAVDLDEPVDQGRAPLPQRLHLGALEDQAGLVGVLDVVVVARLLVLRDELAPLLPGHPTILSVEGNRDHVECQDSQFIGSTALPLTRIVKCRWQPVDQPVDPT